MLIRLDNGDWVDPKAVTAIIPSSRPMVEGLVSIQTAGGPVSSTRFGTEREAYAAADRIAAQINEALGPKP